MRDEVCSRAGLGVLGERIISCHYRDLNTGPPDTQPSRFTDYAVRAAGGQETSYYSLTLAAS
jgi:hypothetical protein